MQLATPRTPAAAAALLAGEYAPVIELLTLAGALPPDSHARVRREIAVPQTEGAPA